MPEADRYPNCRPGDFKGNPVLLLNPTEVSKFKLLSFGPVKIGQILAKWAAIEQFVRDQGTTKPDGCDVFEYKGNKMLHLNPGPGAVSRFQFGLAKAQIILDRKVALTNFYEDHKPEEVLTELPDDED